MERKINRTKSEKIIYGTLMCITVLWLLNDIFNPMFYASWLFWLLMLMVFIVAFIKSIVYPFVIVKDASLVFYNSILGGKTELNIDSIVRIICRKKNGIELLEIQTDLGDVFKIMPSINNKRYIRLLIAMFESCGYNVEKG